MTWVVVGCGYLCRSGGRCGQVWADMGKGGQRRAGLDGQTDRAGMGDMGGGCLWICVQV